MPEFPSDVRRRFRSARSKGQKLALAPKEPKLVMARQSLVAIRFLDEIFEIIRKLLLPALRSVETKQDCGCGFCSVYRKDGLPTIIQKTIDVVELQIGQLIDLPTIEKASENSAKELASANTQQLKRLLKVDIDPEVRPLLRGFVQSNTTLIKSQSSQVVAKIRGLLDGKLGTRVEDLAQEMEQVFGVSKSKARLIARDQTLKLNGQITQATQVSVGIEKYEWVTSGDSRVRPIHDELNGTIQRWDTPPVISDDGRTGHPGEDYQCRCVALAIIPD